MLTCSKQATRGCTAKKFNLPHTCALPVSDELKRPANSQKLSSSRRSQKGNLKPEQNIATDATFNTSHHLETDQAQVVHIMTRGKHYLQIIMGKSQFCTKRLQERTTTCNTDPPASRKFPCVFLRQPFVILEKLKRLYKNLKIHTHAANTQLYWH